MNKKILSLVLVLAMLLTSLVMVVPASATTTEELKTKGYILRVHASSTANGESIVFLLSDGTFMVFDGGGSATDAQHLSEQLQSIATAHGLDEVVISMWNFTHPHGDHMGFLNSWSTYASNVEVREIWYNPTDWGGTSYGNLLAGFYPNATIKAVHAGEEYQFADVHVKILWAADDTNEQYYETGTYGTANYTDLYGTSSNGSYADQNNASTIMKLTIGSKSILLGGDAGYEPFEYIYNSTTNNVSKNDLDCDIFQVTHHSVGSASSPAIYSTPNNKHFAVMTPETIILPAGLNVVNMTLSGSRANTSGTIAQNWDGATKATDYDGYYGLLKTFGIVDAAAKEGTAIFDSEDEFTKYQTGTTADGKAYYMAGWLNPDDYEGTKGKQEFFTADTDSNIINTKTEMVAGASVRVVTDEKLAGSGIRFTSNVSAETVTTLEGLKTAGKISAYSFGTVIFRAESLDSIAGAPSVQSLAAAGEQYVDIAAEDGLVEADGGYQINAAIVNIKEKNYGRAFAAVSYIEYTLANGNKMRVYSDFSETDNVRAIATVALAALNDLQTTSGEVDGWNYKYAVTTTTVYQNGLYVEKTLDATQYSLYSAAKREVLASYLINPENKADYDGDDTMVDPW